MRKKYIYLTVFLGSFLLTPSIALGQITLNLTYPTFGGFNPASSQGLDAVLGWLYYLMVGVAGLAAFIMLVWGGVQWLSSAGNPTRISDARDRIQTAILGLLLILASFVILQIINPGLTTIALPGVNVVEITVGSAPVDPYFSDIYSTWPKAPPPNINNPNWDVFDPANAGIYFCAKKSCSCTSDAPPVCDGNIDSMGVVTFPGGATAGDDYYFVPAAAISFATTYTLDPVWAGPPGKNNGQVRAIAMVQPPAGTRFDLVVMQTTAAANENGAVCFEGAIGAADLDWFLLEDVPAPLWPIVDNGWAEDVEQFRKLFPRPGGPSPWGKCWGPGITIDSYANFQNNPVAFFFDKRNFGADGTRFMRRSCAYFAHAPYDWGPDDFGPPSPLTTEGPGCGPRGTIHSLWISPSLDIGCLQPPGSTPARCATVLMECNGVTPCAQTSPLPGDDPEDYERICFNRPVPNIRLPEFSFNNEDDSDDLRKDIHYVYVVGEGYTQIPVLAPPEYCQHGVLITPELP